MNALRSMIAFVVPALAGILVLIGGQLLGRHWARNKATQLIGWLGPRLAGFRIKVDDPKGLASVRPAVFVFNHQSGADPAVLCHVLRRDVVGVAKQELRRHILLGPLLTLAGTVFVDRSAKPGTTALAPALRTLDRGLAVGIAPQGTRRHDTGRLHPGAIWLARSAGVPLIPILIHDSDRVLPPDNWKMTPGTVHVRVLPALDPETVTLAEMEQVFRDNLGF